MKKLQMTVIYLGITSTVAVAVALSEYSDGGLVAGLVAVLFFEWILPVVVCFRKGKRSMAILGIGYPPMAWIGAWRLALPDSEYALENYPPLGDKMLRAMERFSAGRTPSGAGQSLR